jgi:hypothetical protein
MSDLRKYILILAMLGIVLILEYSTFLAGMDMLPGFQQSPPEDVMGSVQITTEPTGALVYFDNVNTSQITPFFEMEVLPGKHNVTVTLAGYQTQSEEFEVFSQNITYVRMILIPINQSQGSQDPAQPQDLESTPSFDGDDPAVVPPPLYTSIEDPITITIPGPVPVPAPEFPSPAVPAVILIGCAGMVMVFSRFRE